MSVARVALRRTYATAAGNAASGSSRVTISHSTSNASAALLGNIEASWKNLPKTEQEEVYKKLEEIQKKDWKELTVDEKKAAYYVSYGPHGPRTPDNTPGTSMRVLAGTAAAVGAAVGVFLFARSRANEPPKTLNREYQEGITERFKEEKINPITGISSEGYKGKGMVTVP